MLCGKYFCHLMNRNFSHGFIFDFCVMKIISLFFYIQCKMYYFRPSLAIHIQIYMTLKVSKKPNTSLKIIFINSVGKLRQCPSLQPLWDATL